MFHGLAATIFRIGRLEERDGESISKEFLSIALIAPPTFPIAPRSLLLKKENTVCKLRRILILAYWLLAALLFLGRFFEATRFRSALCFLCFTTAVLFAFAAGAASYRTSCF
jgi:hypothetical protein